jgi:hypothetical protein
LKTLSIALVDNQWNIKQCCEPGQERDLQSDYASFLEGRVQDMQHFAANSQVVLDYHALKLQDGELRHRLNMLQQKLTQAEPVQTISFCLLCIWRARA